MERKLQLSPIQRTTLTAYEVAEYLGISYWLVLELTKQGKIPHTKAGGRYLYRIKALDEWMDRMEQESLNTSHDEIATTKEKKGKVELKIV